MGVTMCQGAPWYRELNIMNRVLNADFGPESCYKFTPDLFSDVFRPASCMQNCHLSIPEKRMFSLYSENLKTIRAVPAKENLMRSCNAC